MADLAKTRERQQMEEMTVGGNCLNKFFDDNHVTYIRLRITKSTHTFKKRFCAT